MEHKLIKYEAMEELIKYRITSDPEPQLNPGSQGVGPETRNLTQPKTTGVAEQQAESCWPFKRLKKTYWIE